MAELDVVPNKNASRLTTSKATRTQTRLSQIENISQTRVKPIRIAPAPQNDRVGYTKCLRNSNLTVKNQNAASQ